MISFFPPSVLISGSLPQFEPAPHYSVSQFISAISWYSPLRLLAQIMIAYRFLFSVVTSCCIFITEDLELKNRWERMYSICISVSELPYPIYFLGGISIFLQISFFFGWWIVFHCVYPQHFHYQFTCWGHLCCFHFLAIWLGRLWPLLGNRMPSPLVICQGVV